MPVARPSNVATRLSVLPSQSNPPTGCMPSRSHAEKTRRNIGYCDPNCVEQVRQQDGGEPVGLEVDDVDAPGRVTQDLLGRDVGAQPGLARRQQDRVVVGQAIDGARAQAGHDAAAGRLRA